MTVAQSDIHWMSLALQQAKKGLFTTSPNPRVGCVIVKNNQLLASGFHLRAGEPHAERNALNQLTSQQAYGATCYVTLEPCSHTGRTGPCADALIQAGVSNVVVAIRDPNPQVAGQGIKKLKAAGIEVVEGVLLKEAAQLNAGFIKRFTQGKPLVRVKLAISLDGRTAMASGESFWITGAEAREDVQRLRAQSCAIITGSGTLLVDNPSMTVRPTDWRFSHYGSDWVRQPLRVLVSANTQVGSSNKLFSANGKSLIATTTESNAQLLESKGLQAIAVGTNDAGGVNLEALLNELAQCGCNEVLVEAGATLSAAFIEQDLADELIVYQAPVLLGQKAKPALALNIDTMANKQPLTLIDERRIGQDWRFTFDLKA